MEEQTETEEVVPAGPIQQPESDTDSDFLMPIMGQIAYLTVALFATSGHYMKMFRWTKDTKAGVSYYNTWKTYESVLGSTDYHKLADTVLGYGGLAIWGVASLSTLVSFVALHELNLQVWKYGVTYGTLLVGVIYNLLMLLAIQKTSGKASNILAQQDADIGGLMLQINYNWLGTNAAYAFASAVLWGNMRNFAKF